MFRYLTIGGAVVVASGITLGLYYYGFPSRRIPTYSEKLMSSKLPNIWELKALLPSSPIEPPTITIIRQIRWNQRNAVSSPDCFMVWHGRPSTVYMYKISSQRADGDLSLDVISGIVDNSGLNDTLYQAHLLATPTNRLFRALQQPTDEDMWFVSLTHQPSMSTFKLEPFKPHFIEVDEKTSLLEYNAGYLELTLKMNELPSQNKPLDYLSNGVCIIIKVNSDEPFFVGKEAIRILNTSYIDELYSYTLCSSVYIGEMDVSRNAIRVEVLLFSAPNNTCAAYVIEHASPK